MTSGNGTDVDVELGPLPDVVSVTQAFASRMPTQRVQDLLTRLEGGTFGDLIQAQPFRVSAFRKLLAAYPDRDPTSLWMHAYDVEVDFDQPDPTSSGSATESPSSAATTA